MTENKNGVASKASLASPRSTVQMQKYGVPFERQHQLVDCLDQVLGSNTASSITVPSDIRLPGHPSKRLYSTTALSRFLLDDLTTPELDTLGPRLWMMSTYSSSNINPLHFQKAKGREIVICEFPRLHLTWKHSQIFIKPLPKYLLSYAFWDFFLVSGSSPLGARHEELCRAAKGLLRTYYHLVKHESDFEMARSSGLLPKDISWERFSDFVSSAGKIQDSEVSPRYSYGEIRLTRLNFYSKFFLRRWRYEWGRPQYSSYFNRFYGHILFIFALLSLLLNALQVELATESLVSHQWSGMWYLSRYFSVICLAFFVFVGISLGGWLTYMISSEWVYAIRAVRRKRKNPA